MGRHRTRAPSDSSEVSSSSSGSEYYNNVGGRRPPHNGGNATGEAATRLRPRAARKNVVYHDIDSELDDFLESDDDRESSKDSNAEPLPVALHNSIEKFLTRRLKSDPLREHVYPSPLHPTAPLGRGHFQPSSHSLASAITDNGIDPSPESLPTAASSAIASPAHDSSSDSTSLQVDNKIDAPNDFTATLPDPKVQNDEEVFNLGEDTAVDICATVELDESRSIVTPSEKGQASSHSLQSSIAARKKEIDTAADESHPSSGQRKTRPPEYEYLVKYQNVSYLHVEWLSEIEVQEAMAHDRPLRTRFNNFIRKLESGQDIPELDLLECVPERIVDCSDVFRALYPTKAAETRKDNWRMYCLKIVDAVVCFHRDQRVYGIPFLRPVEEDKDGAPNYYNVVKTPMDFSTVQTKLYLRQYETPQEFWADCKLIFKNCYEYNAPRTDISTQGRVLEALFDKLYAEWAKMTHSEGKTTETAAPKQEDHEMEQQQPGDVAPSSEITTERHEEQHDHANVESPFVPLATEGLTVDQVIQHITFKRVLKEPSRQMLYLVKWKGRSYSDNSWELVSDISDTMKISQYHRHVRVPEYVMDVRGPGYYEQDLQRKMLEETLVHVKAARGYLLGNMAVSVQALPQLSSGGIAHAPKERWSYNPQVAPQAREQFVKPQISHLHHQPMTSHNHHRYQSHGHISRQGSTTAAAVASAAADDEQRQAYARRVYSMMNPSGGMHRNSLMPGMFPHQMGMSNVPVPGPFTPPYMPPHQAPWGINPEMFAAGNPGGPMMPPPRLFTMPDEAHRLVSTATGLPDQPQPVGMMPSGIPIYGQPMTMNPYYQMMMTQQTPFNPFMNPSPMMMPTPQCGRSPFLDPSVCGNRPPFTATSQPQHLSPGDMRAPPSTEFENFNVTSSSTAAAEDSVEFSSANNGTLNGTEVPVESAIMTDDVTEKPYELTSVALDGGIGNFQMENSYKQKEVGNSNAQLLTGSYHDNVEAAELTSEKNAIVNSQCDYQPSNVTFECLDGHNCPGAADTVDRMEDLPPTAYFSTDSVHRCSPPAEEECVRDAKENVEPRAEAGETVTTDGASMNQISSSTDAPICDDPITTNAGSTVLGTPDADTVINGEAVTDSMASEVKVASTKEEPEGAAELTDPKVETDKNDTEMVKSEKTEEIKQEKPLIDRTRPASFAATSIYAEEFARMKQPKPPPPGISRHYPVSPVYKGGRQLFDYQLEGLNWMLNLWGSGNNGILADEMGLGKTIQTMALLWHLYTKEKHRGPFLVIAPLSTLDHWKMTADNWTDFNTILYYDEGGRAGRDALRRVEWYHHILDWGGQRQSSASGKGEKANPRLIPSYHYKFQLLLTSYEIFSTDAELLVTIPWQFVTVDEAHRLKNRFSKGLQILRQVACRHVLLLTGTPVQNNTEELWPLLNYIEPVRFCDLEAFKKEFGELQTNEQVTRLTALLRPHLLRRVKDDVAASIPPLEETIIDVELTMIQKAYYKAIFERNKSFLFKNLRKGQQLPNLMNIEMELRKCCNHPFMIQGVEEREYATCKTEEEKYKKLVESSGKLVLLTKLLPKLKAEKHKVLIFSQFQNTLGLIQDFVQYQRWEFERLDGQVKGTERAAAIARFNDRSLNKFVFLLSTRAGGLGINLTSADTVIIFDSDWNPQNDVQATARAHRIGQEREVKVYRLVTARTYESDMFERASRKLGLNTAVFHRGAFDSKSRKSGADGDDDGSAGLTAGKAPSKDEIEDLLKRGAFYLLEGNTEVARQFQEGDIDEILSKNSRLVRYQLTGMSSSFAKTSFKSDKASDLSLDDPDFWQKVLNDSSSRRLLARLNDGSATASQESMEKFMSDLRVAVEGIAAEDDPVPVIEALVQMSNLVMFSPEYRQTAELWLARVNASLEVLGEGVYKSEAYDNDESKTSRRSLRQCKMDSQSPEAQMKWNVDEENTKGEERKGGRRRRLVGTTEDQESVHSDEEIDAEAKGRAEIKRLQRRLATKYAEQGDKPILNTDFDEVLSESPSTSDNDDDDNPRPKKRARGGGAARGKARSTAAAHLQTAAKPKRKPRKSAAVMIDECPLDPETVAAALAAGIDISDEAVPVKKGRKGRAPGSGAKKRNVRATEEENEDSTKKKRRAPRKKADTTTKEVSPGMPSPIELPLPLSSEASAPVNSEEALPPCFEAEETFPAPPSIANRFVTASFTQPSSDAIQVPLADVTMNETNLLPSSHDAVVSSSYPDEIVGEMRRGTVEQSESLTGGLSDSGDHGHCRPVFDTEHYNSISSPSMRQEDGNDVQMTNVAETHTSDPNSDPNFTMLESQRLTWIKQTINEYSEEQAP